MFLTAKKELKAAKKKQKKLEKKIEMEEEEEEEEVIKLGSRLNICRTVLNCSFLIRCSGRKACNSDKEIETCVNICEKDKLCLRTFNDLNCEGVSPNCAFANCDLTLR